MLRSACAGRLVQPFHPVAELRAAKDDGRVGEGEAAPSEPAVVGYNERGRALEALENDAALEHACRGLGRRAVLLGFVECGQVDRSPIFFSPHVFRNASRFGASLPMAA